MARNSILVIVMLFCMALAKGQDFKVEVSPMQRGPLTQVFQEYLHSDESGHYLYHFLYSDIFSIKPGKSKGVVFEKYDPKFNLVYSKDLRELAPKAHSAGVVLMEDHFVWIRTERNESDEHVEVRLTSISKNGDISQPILISKDRFEGKTHLPETRYALSKDRTKLLLVTYSDKNFRGLRLEMVLTVVDPLLQIVWQNRLKLPYSERQLDIQNWTIDNQGNALMLTKVSEDDEVEGYKLLDGQRVATYKMSVFKFSAGESAAKERDIPLGGVFATDAQLTISPKGEPRIAGLFSNDYNGSLQGLFLAKMNPSDDIITTADKKHFSEDELLKMGYKNIEYKKDEWGLSNSYAIGELLFLEDGNSFVTVQALDSTTMDAQTTATQSFRSGDIVVLQFSPEGIHNNIYIIPKRQYCSMKEPLGNIAFATGEKVCFFYYDSKKNLKKPFGEKSSPIFTTHLSIGVLTTLDSSGKMERIPLISTTEFNLPLAPSMCSLIDSKSLFFIAIEYKFNVRFRVGRVLLPDWGE